MNLHYSIVIIALNRDLTLLDFDLRTGPVHVLRF